MNCENVKPLIDPLIDNELPTETTAHVIEHISTCLSCQSLWDSRLKLRERFRNFAANIKPPQNAMERMDQKLESLSIIIPNRQTGFTIAAAIALLVGMLSLLSLSAPVTVTAQQLAGDFSRNQTATDFTSLGLKMVSDKVGFEVNPPDLGEWKLVSTDVYQVGDRKHCLAKLTYESSISTEAKRVSLYQSCAGKMKPEGLKEIVVAGRKVCCGQLGDVSIVYLKKQGIDNIMIGKMPEKQLVMLAMGV